MKIPTALALAAFLAVPAVAGDALAVLHQNDVIEFQGDSITEGGRQREGSDYNHIMGQDYAYIIAAQIGALYPERNLTFLNRGISGNTVIDLAARWQYDTLDLKPHFLSILIGVNDLMFPNAKGESVAQYEQVYDQLLADTLAALPNTKIVLGQPFLLPTANPHGWPNLKDKATFAAKMLELKPYQDAVTRLAKKYHLPQVLYQAAFDEACRKAPPEHWSWDGVHATYAGHGLMVQEWLKTVNAFWPKGS
ncbi:MAG: SGNH/GDSL hydrolase family protein [Verrucomicrobiota bacterium]